MAHIVNKPLTLFETGFPQYPLTRGAFSYLSLICSVQHPLCLYFSHCVPCMLSKCTTIFLLSSLCRICCTNCFLLQIIRDNHGFVSFSHVHAHVIRPDFGVPKRRMDDPTGCIYQGLDNRVYTEIWQQAGMSTPSLLKSDGSLKTQ